MPSDIDITFERDAADGLGQTRFKRFERYAPRLVLNRAVDFEELFKLADIARRARQTKPY